MGIPQLNLIQAQSSTLHFHNTSQYLEKKLFGDGIMNSTLILLVMVLLSYHTLAHPARPDLSDLTTKELFQLRQVLNGEGQDTAKGTNPKKSDLNFANCVKDFEYADKDCGNCCNKCDFDHYVCYT